MSEIERFEADCLAAGVSPSDALRAAELAPSTWFRWKSGATSPTLRKLNAARSGLTVLIERHAVSSSSAAPSMAPPTSAGAENSDVNVSGTERRA